MSNIRKTWFITGAASGFGRAFATYALSKGYNVVATARDIARLDGLAAQAPDRVLAHALDVNRPETRRPRSTRRSRASAGSTC